MSSIGSGRVGDAVLYKGAMPIIAWLWVAGRLAGQAIAVTETGKA